MTKVVSAWPRSVLERPVADEGTLCQGTAMQQAMQHCRRERRKLTCSATSSSV